MSDSNAEGFELTFSGEQRTMSTERCRIVLGDWSLATFPTGGGYWVIHLQYMLGLKALGHDTHLLELLYSKGDAARDQQRIDAFFHRMKEYGLSEQCVLLLFKDESEPDINLATAYGKTKQETREIIASADLLWNLCCHVRQPLLGMFKRRVLIDLDPGVLQVSALTAKMDLFDHHAFLTVGTKLQDADCEVPRLGLNWHPFVPFVYLPMWKTLPDPGPDAPFTSVTNWGWGALKLKGRPRLSTSKGSAYLKYLELPQKTGRPFELAVRIHPDGPEADQTGVAQQMETHGWRLVDPRKVVDSPSAYQSYIARSRAEILCPKPIFKELRTGWLSDRSVCYLASGRPVLAEDTGFSEHLPTGAGLLSFQNLHEAEAGVAEIDSNYGKHTNAARDLAQEYFDSESCLKTMLDASV